MKNTWLEIEVNARDFMTDVFCELCTNYDTAAELDQLEKDLQRVGAEGARRDQYGRPAFQVWFYEQRGEQWREMLEIIHSAQREYIAQHLSK